MERSQPGQLGRRLTPEEREQIITLRLQGVPVRKVAELLPTTTATVVAVTKKYLAERSEEFDAKADATIEKIVARHLAAADAAAVAAEAALAAGEDRTAAGWFAEERARLDAVAKLAGLFIERVETTGVQVVRIREQVDGDDSAPAGD
jgi:pyruvoyl-dependent arginine decarboxylase (PvlArgDC)